MSSTSFDQQQAQHYDVASVNWKGLIPVHLTLAPTSLSSPTLPLPIHVLVPRNTYLHTGLEAAVQRLHPFAPTSPFSAPTTTTAAGSSSSSTTSLMFHVSEPSPGGGRNGAGSDDDDNNNNVDDGETAIQEPSNATKFEAYGTANSNSIASSQQHQQRPDNHSLPNPTPAEYPVCWLEDEDTQLAVRWHLFAGVLFDLKASPTLPWRLKLHFNNYPTTQILPLDANVLTAVQASFKHSLKQALTLQQGNSKGAMNVTKESHGLLWEAVRQSNLQVYRRVDLKLDKMMSTPPVISIPIRMLVNATAPPIQRRVRPDETPTLGDLLHQWLEWPSDNDNNNDNHVMVRSCRICGVEPPWSTLLLDLWYHCAHPDQFLYVCVLTNDHTPTTTTTTTAAAT